MTEEACFNHLAIFCVREGKELPKSFPIKKLQEEEFILKAIKEKPFLITYLRKFVPEKLLNNDDFVRKAASINGYALSVASDRLLSDKDFVLNAVKNNPSALQFAPDYLKDDKNLVLELIDKYGYCLEFASERLKSDPELMEKAAAQIATGPLNRDMSLLKRKEFAKLLVSKKAMYFVYLDEKLRNDRELALLAINKCETCYRYLGDDLKKDRELALEAIKSFSTVYTDLDDVFKNDPEIAAYAYYNGSQNTRSKIPLNLRFSSRFTKYLNEIRKNEKSAPQSKPHKEETASPKFIVSKKKANPTIYTISVDWNGKKEELSPQIEIRNRFIFAIDDYAQPQKGVVLFRYIVPSYDKEIEQNYNSLASEIKELISYDNFFKQIKKKLKDKEVCTYREIRFAFRKCDDGVKVFTFYNPFKRTDVMSLMGIYMTHPRAWYTNDLEQAMKQIDGFKNKDFSSLKGVESRATDEASYYELEEANYIVHIEQVNMQAAKESPSSFINDLVNSVLEEAKEDEKEPVNVFNLNQYESVIQGDDHLGLPKEFEKLFLKAMDEAR